MALRVCVGPGRGARCPSAELIPKGTSRCSTCAGTADRNRGTATERGYTGKGHQAFRYQVLAEDPICVLCRKAKATVADHYPHSRRDLIRMDLNPDDPRYGRGLCHTCHSVETAAHQPGGWHST